MADLITRLLAVVAACGAAVGDLVLPRTCGGCGLAAERDLGSRGMLCPSCRAELDRPAHPSRPDPCPPGLPPTFAVAAYDGVVRAALLAHKEQRRFALVQPLGAALARSLLDAAGPGEPLLAAAGPGERVFVVPVPSARAAVRARGHDPTGRLVLAATAAARRSGAHVTRLPALRHTRRAADQAGLSSAQRAANLHGALEVRPGWVRALAGARVVVADDVITTGATLVEAARALRGGGAVVVGAAVVAATQRRHNARPAVPGPSRPESDQRTTVSRPASVGRTTPLSQIGASVSTWHPPGSVVAPGRPDRETEVACPGKPMPAAGETAHVRRLFVDRSRCGLEVSPASPDVPTASVPREGQ